MFELLVVIEELWLLDEDADPAKVKAVATGTVVGKEESVRAGTLVT